MKRFKCLFSHLEVAYLGVLYFGRDDDQKMLSQAGQNRHTIASLLGFLGLIGYYHKFVKNCGLIALPLTKLV